MENVVWIFMFFLIGIAIGFFHKAYKSEARKKMVSNWKVGDVILVDKDKIPLSLFKDLKGKNSVTLSGWNKDYVFLNIGDYTYSVEYNCIEHNKSAIWRLHYNNCEKYMGIKPKFSDEVSKPEIEETINKELIYGEPIETLNETQCEVYLKKALENQEFEIAEKIKKRMEKFR